MRKERPHTPDGRYFVARDRLRRCTNPDLSDTERRRLIKQLMQARMAARAAADEAGQQAAAEQVHAAKVALGEAGPVWWNDGAEDVSGLAPDATTYADWWQTVADKRSGE